MTTLLVVDKWFDFFFLEKCVHYHEEWPIYQGEAVRPHSDGKTMVKPDEPIKF